MGHRDDARPGAVEGDAQESGRRVRDRRWAGELVSSVRCSVVLLALLLLIDWGSGHLTWWRSLLWFALAALLFVVLCPARISAGDGWLASRSLLRGQRVRTDLLVSVRSLDGVSQRLVFRDAFGGRVEIDPQVLVDNPELWYRLDEDAQQSAAHGTLLCGGTELRRVSQRVDRETALTVFKVSGLE